MGTEQDLKRYGNASDQRTDHFGAESDSDAIKRRIDHTRASMDETIDALSARLQPRNLVHEALNWAGYPSHRVEAPSDSVTSFVKAVGFDLLQTFRDSAKDAAVAGTKKAATRTWRLARCHPAPAALIATGVAWLVYEGACTVSNKAQRKGWTLHNPDPSYGGSYVDARTGEPYERSTYGQSATGSHETSEYEANPMQSQRSDERSDAFTSGPVCPPGFEREPASFEDARQESAEGGRLREMTRHARDTAAGAAEGARQRVSRASDAARTGMHAVSDRARDAAQAVTHGVESAAHALRSGAETAAHTVSTGASTAVHRLADTTRSAAHQVRSGYDYSRDRLSHAVDEYPLALGVAAMGAGVLLGLALPRTRREEALLGEQARQLRERAREMGHEALERGRHAARETVGAVKQEIERQGLTPDRLKGAARDFASRVADDVRDEAEEAGLTMGAVRDKAKQVAEKAQVTARREVMGDSGDSGSDNSNTDDAQNRDMP